MADLWHNQRPVAWEEHLRAYWMRVCARERRGKSSPEPFADLDRWYLYEFPAAVRSRDPPHVERAELERVLEWKLARGKWRPRLAALVASNEATAVRKCSTEALDMVGKGCLQEGMKRLAELKGVGPATASAVLAAVHPECAVFMSDEAMASVPGVQPGRYTLPMYMALAEAVLDKCNELNTAARDAPYAAGAAADHAAAADGGAALPPPPRAALATTTASPVPWTPQRVEMALWVASLPAAKDAGGKRAPAARAEAVAAAPGKRARRR